MAVTCKLIITLQLQLPFFSGGILELVYSYSYRFYSPGSGIVIVAPRMVQPVVNVHFSP